MYVYTCIEQGSRSNEAVSDSLPACRAQLTQLIALLGHKQIRFFDGFSIASRSYQQTDPRQLSRRVVSLSSSLMMDYSRLTSRSDHVLYAVSRVPTSGPDFVPDIHDNWDGTNTVFQCGRAVRLRGGSLSVGMFG